MHEKNSVVISIKVNLTKDDAELLNKISESLFIGNGGLSRLFIKKGLNDFKIAMERCRDASEFFNSFKEPKHSGFFLDYDIGASNIMQQYFIPLTEFEKQRLMADCLKNKECAENSETPKEKIVFNKMKGGIENEKIIA